MIFEVRYWWRPHNHSGQPVPVLGHLHNTSVSWCSKGTISVPLCAHSLFSWLWALLKRAWLHPLCTLPSGIYTHLSDTLETPFLQVELSQLSQPHFIGEVLQSLHHLGSPPRLFLVCPGLSCTVLPRNVQSTPGVASQLPSKEEGSPLLNC